MTLSMQVSRRLDTLLVLLLITAIAGCSQSVDTAPTDAPSDSWQKTSNSGLYDVTIAPRTKDIPIGEFHEWVIGVRDAQGRPVSAMRIAVTGGMPGHGHGLPSQPQVTDYLGEGEYRIEGMRFNMAGAWVLLFQLHSAVGQDQVQFDLDLSF